MKRTLLILTPVILVTLALAGTLKYLHPEIEAFLTGQIRGLSSRFSPVEISVEHIEFHLLPPSIELLNVQIAAKEPAALGFEVLDIDSALADLDFLQLLGGRIGVSTLNLESPEIELNLDAFFGKSNNTAKGLNLNPLFEQLKIVPIHRISVTDLSANIHSKKLDLHLSLVDSSALIVNAGDSIIAEVELDSEQYQYKNLKDTAHLRLGSVIHRDQIEIPQFHLSTLGSDLIIKATIFNLEDFHNSLTARIHAATLADLSLLGKSLQQEFKVPALIGKLKVTTQVEIEQGRLKIGTVETLGEHLNVDGIEIGNLNIAGEWKDDKFKTSNFQVTNEAALVDLKDFEVDFKWHDAKPEATFKTHLKSEMLDLNQLLQNLTVTDIPIELIASGDFQCGGPLFPEPSVTCQGEAHSDLFEARSAYEKGDVIVQIGEVLTSGTVNIDSQRVQYQADLKIGDNQGHSEGRISFANGFEIDYSSPELNFNKIDYLVNLDLQGKAQLSGHIQGDKNHAIFDINFDGRDIWFENFYLGNPKMLVNYKAGILDFNNVTSNINTSRLKAEVSLNLHEHQISITGSSEGLDVPDAIAAFQRKVSLPFDATGTGAVQVHAWGPLDFSHLSYDFETRLEHGNIAGESFDEAKFKVHSDHGEVRIDELRFKKGQGQILGQGLAHPDGTTQFSLETTGMLIEESENVAKLSPNISGQWNSSLQMSGRILDPVVLLDTNIKNLVIEDQDFPSSRSHLRFDHSTISGNADFFEGKLKTDFIFPLVESAPFKLEASARNWNFTTIFTLIGGAPLLSEYQASLTGDLALQAEHGGFFNASGDGTILKAELRRKNLYLSNPGPMEMKMENGKLSLSNFRVSGDEAYAEISSSGSTEKSLNLKTKANLQLHILQIFMPFLDDLSGNATLQASINGPLAKPEILGSGNLENTFIKLKALPHTFEKVSAKAQFSQTKVLVSDIKGNFAGGTASAEGTINIAGMNNLPMLFRGHFDNITANIPDRFKTSGSGDIVFSGNWFPFTLAGTYHVSGGQITKELTDDFGATTAKQSSYLPKILLQNAFDPIHLNMQVILDQSIGINNSIIDGSLTGSVLIQGNPVSPLLSGKIGVEHGAKLIFKDKIFDVSSGTVTFDDQKEINPELFVSAQSHVADYDINLTVQGRARAPIVRLDSLPSLPYQDIVSLLALGMTSSTQDDTGGLQRRDSGAATTQALAAGFGEISKGAQKALDVNVQVTSEYDDTKNMAIQKYSLTGKITDKFTYTGTQTTGDLDSQSFKLKYKINPSVSLSGSYENIESAQSSTSTAVEPPGQRLGIDLEFRQEFK